MTSRVGKMNMSIVGLLTISLIFVAGVVQAEPLQSVADCKELASTFLANPTKETMSALQPQCWETFDSSDANFGGLLHIARNGSHWAAFYVGENLKKTDGSNLEDSLSALGQFSDAHMETLLIFAKESVISESELTDALTMFPESTGEDQRAQLAVMQSRAEKIKRINRKDLVIQKAIALNAIKKFIAQIKAPKTEN